MDVESAARHQDLVDRRRLTGTAADLYFGCPPRGTSPIEPYGPQELVEVHVFDVVGASQRQTMRVLGLYTVSEALDAKPMAP